MIDPEGSFMVGVIALALSRFDNMPLATLNNAIQTWGVVAVENLGYSQALDAKLITEAGKPTFDLDVTRDAFAYEVNRRVEAGTFA